MIDKATSNIICHRCRWGAKPGALTQCNCPTAPVDLYALTESAPGRMATNTPNKTLNTTLNAALWALPSIAAASGVCAYYTKRDMTKENDLKLMKDAAVSALIHWALTDRGEQNLRNQVNGYMAASGVNASAVGDVSIEIGRRIVAQEILRDCITPLPKEYFPKAKTMVFRIVAEDVPQTK